MTYTWIESEVYTLPVEWLFLQGNVEVGDKELLNIRIKGATEGLESGAYFDDFFVLRNLTNEKLTGNDISYQLIENVGSNEIELPVWGAVRPSQIMAAHIVSKEDIIGNDNITLKLVNKETGLDICTLTFFSGNDAQAYKIKDFGPVSETNRFIEVGESVSFVKEGSGYLPTINLIIQYNLA